MMIFKIVKKKTYIFFILFLIFFLISFIEKKIVFSEPDYSKKIKSVEKTLEKKKVVLETVFQKLESEIKKKNDFFNPNDFEYYNDLSENKGIYLYVYAKDSLCFWSDNSVLINNIKPEDSLFSHKVIKLDNGWYYKKQTKIGDYDVTGLILILNKFRYQNEYLVNTFQKEFSVDEECRLSLKKGEYSVNDSDGSYLFSVKFKNSTNARSTGVFILLLSFILAYIFFISLLINLQYRFEKHTGKKWSYLFLFPVVIIGIRLLTFMLKIPSFLYETDLFSPKFYASSAFLPSLGDLLLNVIVLFYVFFFIFEKLRLYKPKLNVNKISAIVVSFVLFSTLPVMLHMANALLRGLIVNSSISFDLNNIFALNTYSAIGYIIIAFLWLAFFFASYSICVFVVDLLKSKTKFFIVSFASLLLVFLANLWISYFENSQLIFLLGFVFVSGYFIHKNGRKFSVRACIILIVLFSLISAHSIFKYNTYKEREKRKLLAMQLSVEQDPIAEYLFSDLEKKIWSDTAISRQVFEKETDESKITEILKDHYFTGYWSKYNVQVTVCKPGQELIIKPDNIKTQCDSFFSSMINYSGIETLNTDLYFLNNGSGRNNYIAAIPYYEKINDTIPEVKLYVELYAKFYPKEMGYPELLIDKNININKDIYNYSYAKYRNKELILQYGKYSYGLLSDVYGKSDKEFIFFNLNGYDHLIYKPDRYNEILISCKSRDILDIIAPFSYIFIFFCAIVSIMVVLLRIPFKISDIQINFKSRLQLSMIFVLVVSFVIIGISTLYYIINMYDKKNTDIISEKAHSILIEMEGKIGYAEKITPDMSIYISELLTKFSNVFFTDVNLYDLNGMLIASSRPQVFDEGYISKKINTKAFYELGFNGKTLFIHDEKIGTLHYTSAYVPLVNDQSKITGFINLPYFAKQSELKNEISSYFVAFININVLLTAIAIIIALLISNYITRPLRIIKSKMGRFSLGKMNEKIEWKRRDEIGSLIQEYNRLIDELSMSAELLARSERESAWREMAKQVAHEIKNPLTPMKLSTQYLKKAWDDKAPDWDERLNKFTRTMVEQIDSLSRIASEFSTFAKMPRANIEEIDFVPLIESTISLFSDFQIPIVFEKPTGEFHIFADKTQLIRVFNNLIKNSLQATEENPEGKIEITLKDAEDHYLVTIKDNGGGIPVEKQDKIFSPYFTTKTGGMGLGLAMVKNIIESYNGKIWFDTHPGIGTAFYFTISKENSI
jgi:two-component system, NtrC family, nitrogen regulation sensor histidine kinase NtrY